MGEIINLFLLALLGSVIALFGGVVFLYNDRLSSALEKHSIPFAAGVLVVVALLGLLPEAVDYLGEGAFIIVLISFLAVYIFEHLFFGLHHHKDEEHISGKSFSIPLVVLGDTIHNFIDGIEIGATFLSAPGLGFVTAISTFLHEIPHEIGDFGVMLKSGWKRSDILIVNIFSSLTTIIGAFTIYFINENDTLIGTLMAISAGIFLYLGASDFLPKIEKDKNGGFKSILPLIIGAGAMILVLLLVPHSH